MSRSVSEEILALTETGKTKRISKTVAISGASSFTGIWIARAFHERGYSVHALLSSQEGSYTDIKAVRVRFLQQHATLHHNVRAENGSMATWIEKNSPSLWIHHHHFMENFRNKDYDLTQAEAVGIEPLLKIVDALAKASCAGMIYSGTYFEPGEGGQAEDAPATPYAISKKKVWKHLLNETQKASLPISKVVIANPIGPFENEDRMIPNLVRAAKIGGSMKLTSPQTVGDQIPVWDLAYSYIKAANYLLESGEKKILRPSGSVETVKKFAEEVNRGFIQARLGLPLCNLEIASTTTPASHFENPAIERKPIDWFSFWSEYSRVIQEANYSF